MNIYIMSDDSFENGPVASVDGSIVSPIFGSQQSLASVPEAHQPDVSLDDDFQDAQGDDLLNEGFVEEEKEGEGKEEEKTDDEEKEEEDINITDFTSLDKLKKIIKFYKRRAIPKESPAETYPDNPVLPTQIILSSKKEALAKVIHMLNMDVTFHNKLTYEKVKFKIDSGVDMGGVKREIYTHLANELSRFTKLDLSTDLDLTPETPCDEAKLQIVNDFKNLIQDINVREILKIRYKVDTVFEIYDELLIPIIEEQLQKIFKKGGIIILKESFTQLFEILNSTKNVGYTTNITMKQLFAFLHKNNHTTETFTTNIPINVYKLICIALFGMTEEHADYYLTLPNAPKAVLWMYISALDDANYVSNFKQQYVADKGKAFYFGRMGLPESIRPAESEEDEDDMTIFEQYEEYASAYKYNGILNMDELVESVYNVDNFFDFYYTLNPDTELTAEQIESFITNNLKYDYFTTSYVPHAYVPFQYATKTRITNMIRDYTTGLSDALKEEYQQIFPTQDAFLKKLFEYWTGSKIINQSKTYAITNRTSQFIVSHTCFYWLEMNEAVITGKSQDEFISMVVATINEEGGFNMAGGRRRRFKRSMKKKPKKSSKRFKKTLKK
jgi:hypothetical protein